MNILHCLTTAFQTECFNERVPTEKQAYMNFLGRESKGVTDITHRLGYQHGRPLNISP